METKKRQIIPIETALYIVPTPIGNLGDITVRALEIMKSLTLICCEDTRKTMALFRALNIPLGAKLVRWDNVAEYSKGSSKLLGEIDHCLSHGQSVGLMSDAGTPVISDPGAFLVKEVTSFGHPVFVLPGASAVTTFVSATGLNFSSYWFRSFFPRKNPIKELDLVSENPGVLFVYFESPLRIAETLEGIFKKYPHFSVVIAKELTKIHEAWFRGSADLAVQWIKKHEQSEGSVGEWVFGVMRDESDSLNSSVSLISDCNTVLAKKCLEMLIKYNVSAKDASREISQTFGISKNQMYEEALNIKSTKIKVKKII